MPNHESTTGVRNLRDQSDTLLMLSRTLTASKSRFVDPVGRPRKWVQATRVTISVFRWLMKELEHSPKMLRARAMNTDGMGVWSLLPRLHRYLAASNNCSRRASQAKCQLMWCQERLISTTPRGLKDMTSGEKYHQGHDGARQIRDHFASPRCNGGQGG